MRIGIIGSRRPLSYVDLRNDILATTSKIHLPHSAYTNDILTYIYMNSGVGLQAAEYCRKAELPWVAVVAFKEMWKTWPAHISRRYHKVLHDAAQIIYTDREHIAALGRRPMDIHERWKYTKAVYTLIELVAMSDHGGLMFYRTEAANNDIIITSAQLYLGEFSSIGLPFEGYSSRQKLQTMTIMRE
jgi:hypothetical protein